MSRTAPAAVSPTATIDLRDFFPNGDPQPSDAAATTEAFRRADKALAKAGGGTLEIPPGRWLVEALPRDPSVAVILRTAGTTVRGAGILATTLALAEGHDCHVLMIVAPGITVERLTIVGGLQHQPPEVLAGEAVPARRSHGISIRECPAFTLIRDVLIEDVVGYGIGSIIVRGGPKPEPDPFVHVRMHNVTLRRIGDDGIDFKIDVDIDHPDPDGPDPARLGRLGPRGFLKNIAVVDHSVLGPNGTADRVRGENGVDARGQLHLQNIEVLRVRPGGWGKHGGAGITFRDETGPGRGVSSASHGRGGQWSTLQNYHLTRCPKPDYRNSPGAGVIAPPVLAPVLHISNGTEVLLPGGPRFAPLLTRASRANDRVGEIVRRIRRPSVPEAATFAEMEPTLSKGDYTFFDFGGGFGASIAHYQSAFGGRGLGIEIEPDKVVAARAKGRPVVQGSLFEVPNRKLVRYVTADNVLEHLASIAQVEDALRVARGVADEFIYVRHPSFEDEDYLRSLGLSGTWVHRSGHRAHVRLSDYTAMATRLGIDRMEIHPVGLMTNSTDPEIVPLGTPKNDLTYDPARHASRPVIEFDREVFYAFDILFHLTRRPSVRLVYEGDPFLDRKRPILVREVGPMGWPRPTIASTKRRTRTLARAAGDALPPSARQTLVRTVRKVR